MTDKAEIHELLEIAKAANLDGLDFLSQFTEDQLADGYNGIGPEFLGEKVRAKVSEFLHIFKPAAVAHDLRNEMSDGTRKGSFEIQYVRVGAAQSRRLISSMKINE